MMKIPNASSNPEVSLLNPADRTCQISLISSNKVTENCENFSKSNNDCGFTIESVKSISQNIFQNLSDAGPEEGRKNGKRLLEISDKEQTADTAKKKDRMTVCQYCRKWFPRSIIVHHEKLHVRGGITFNCTLCNKDFQESDDFTNHSCTADGD